VYTSDFPVRADIVSFEMAHLFANEPLVVADPRAPGVITLSQADEALRSDTCHDGTAWVLIESPFPRHVPVRVQGHSAGAC